MNLRRIFLLKVAAIVALLLLVPAPGYAQQGIETTNRAGIKLSYIPVAKLNDVELRQVLWEARQVGITNVESVRTVYGISGLSRHVIVKSKERVDGRNVFYETLSMGRKSWESDGRKGGFLQTSDFLVEASGKQRHFERTYELGGNRLHVTMLEKEVSVADKAIPLIAARKFRVEGELADREFSLGKLQLERADLSKPSVFRKTDSDSMSQYEVEFSGNQFILYLRLENGEVVVTRFGRYSI